MCLCIIQLCIMLIMHRTGGYIFIRLSLNRPKCTTPPVFDEISMGIYYNTKTISGRVTAHTSEIDSAQIGLTN